MKLILMYGPKIEDLHKLLISRLGCDGCILTFAGIILSCTCSFLALYALIKGVSRAQIYPKMDLSFFGLPANLTSHSFCKRKHKTCCILVCVFLIFTSLRKKCFFFFQINLFILVRVIKEMTTMQQAKDNHSEQIR